MIATVAFLFEHASGYAILETQMHELDEILRCLKDVSTSFENFSETFKLKFSPFKSAENALENCNQLSEGIAHKNLRKFLRSSLNDGKPYLLYVSERKLGDDINAYASSALPNVTISTESAALEIFRQIRRYFPEYISSFSHHTEVKTHIGLGHSYSRAKVMFNVNRDDNMVMHMINLLDQMDKDINTFSMRIKEWFSYHFPELAKVVPECGNFIKLACIIRSRQDISEDVIEKIEEVIGDHEKAVAIFEAAKSSMGLDVTDQDIEKLAYFTQGIKTFSERRIAAYDYLVSKLTDVAPNLNALIGSQVAARLISHAGSLTKLAKCPASTIQILGAEKALFRALRTRGRTPKYGLLFHSTFIGRAATENKGRISRFLAAKCALASRIDCFSDELCDVFGQKLKKQVEERLQYFENGTLPKTNAEAMEEAVKEAQSVLEKIRADRGNVEQDGILQTEKKKKKHKKSQLAEVEEVPPEVPMEEPLVVEDDEAASSKKKKKKSKKRSHEEMITLATEVEVAEPEPVEEEVPRKKKKKNKHRQEVEEGHQANMEDSVVEEFVPVVDDEQRKRKKKKKRQQAEGDMGD